MKKIIAVLMIAALLCMASMSAMAARSLTDDEKKLIEEMQGKEILGQKVTAADITALENYLLGTDDPLTADDVSSIITNVDEIVAIAAASGVSSVSELPKETKDKIVQIANQVADTAGVVLSVSTVSNGGASSITVTDKTGTPIVTLQEEAIKKTGSFWDSSAVAYIIFVLTIIAGVSVLLFTAPKRNREILAVQ